MKCPYGQECNEECALYCYGERECSLKVLAMEIIKLREDLHGSTG